MIFTCALHLLLISVSIAVAKPNATVTPHPGNNGITPRAELDASDGWPKMPGDKYFGKDDVTIGMGHGTCCNRPFKELGRCIELMNFGGSIPGPESSCAEDWDYYYSCRVNMGITADGQKWMACYHVAVPDNSFTVTQGDVDTMQHLTSAFASQRSNVWCPDDIEGCPLGQGLVAGAKQNWGDFEKFSKQCVETMQEAEASLLDIDVQMTGPRRFMEIWACHDSWRKSEQLYLVDPHDGGSTGSGLTDPGRCKNLGKNMKG